MLLVATLFATACTTSHSDEFQEALDKLDEALALRDDVREIKEAHINIHRTSLAGEHLSYEQQLFNIEQLVDLYYKYQLDYQCGRGYHK